MKKQKTRVRLDSARALDAVEEIRKQQVKKRYRTVLLVYSLIPCRSIVKQRLGAVLWSITYPHLLFTEVRNKVENRKADIQKKMSSNIQMNFEVTFLISNILILIKIAQNFLITVGERYLKEV